MQSRGKPPTSGTMRTGSTARQSRNAVAASSDQHCGFVMGQTVEVSHRRRDTVLLCLIGIRNHTWSSASLSLA